MTKAELAAKVAEVHGLSRAEAGRVLETITSTICEELANGNEVTLAGFGKFGTSTRAERQGRNPQTGASITIPAKTSPKFKALKGLKDAVAK